MVTAGNGLCSFVKERGSDHMLHQGLLSQRALRTGAVKTVRKIRREAEGSNIISRFCMTKLQASILQAETLDEE